MYSSTYTLDWDNQPDPFRTYEGAPRWPLPGTPPLIEFPTLPVIAGLADPNPPAGVEPPRRITAALCGRLLYHAMAISAWKRVRGTDFVYSLRVNPSSGNLHPTETYLLVREAEDLPAGFYHYLVQDHSLERRREGDGFRELAALVGHPWVEQARLVICLTSIFWRESWKYQARAYRYCLLDMGHAASSILAAARALGLPGTLLGHFGDEALSDLLALAGTDEEPMLVIPLGGEPPSREEPSSSPSNGALGPPQGAPNRLSGEQWSFPEMERMHSATKLPHPPGPCPPPPPRVAEEARGATALPSHTSASTAKPFGEVVRIRRSATDYDPSHTLDAEAFGAVLYGATRPYRADWRGNLYEGGVGHPLIHIWCYVHRVDGLVPGCYRYHPESHSLALLKAGDVTTWAAALSLGQSLAGNATAAFSLVGDLVGAAGAFGNRGYRYAHIESGIVGHGLYLGAEAMGWNATGMGAFYDDDVHRYLAIDREAGQVLYHHSIGVALEDDRLLTEGVEPLGEAVAGQPDKPLPIP